MASAPITFDFTGDAPNAYSMSFLQSGLALTVSSAVYDGTYLGTGLVYEFPSPTLSMTADGIGALNTDGDRDAWFDADGRYEMATFSFGQTVQVVSVKLIPLGTRYNTSAADTNFVMFGEGLIRDTSTQQIIDTDFINEVSVTGKLIGLGAVYHIDGFRIAGITVVVLDDNGLPPLSATADAFAVKSSDAPKSFNVLANDTNAQSITSVDTTSLLGSLTLAADGLTVTYDPGTAFDNLAKNVTATETFTYTVLGSDGTSQTQTVTVTVTGSPNEVTGTAYSNTLNGTARHDIIQGLGGNDTINGLGGDDNIDGGIARDLLHGNDGNDYVFGGDGDDTAYGDAGNDTVSGGAGNDVLHGGAGNDSLDGTAGTDRLYGDDGNDVLVGGSSVNILDGGTGADTMSGGGSGDSYYVDDSADTIYELVGEGTDLVRSTVSYTLADNVENLILTGTAATNGTGNSLINQLTGNDGDNSLFGFGANDRLTGGLGHDILVGGLGRDVMTGGVGADEFVFAEWGSSNYDTVTDFKSVDDTILLSRAALGHDLGDLTAAEFGYATTTLFRTTYATTAEQRIIYDQARGDLYFDADGNGAGAKQIIASFVDGTVITFNDILLF